MALKPGQMLGAYQILEQLGQGGMATVYKAYHPGLDRYVAIKVLHQAFQEDANFQARFQREARLVARLEHPHIVPIYDYAQIEGNPYLVMKFIQGHTLKERLKHGALNADELLRIVEAVGSALQYAHSQGILHRDIKPSNVLLTTDDQIYLADFGLARMASSGESTMSADMILGTPQYISPEQARGEKNLDAGTDIYSFGVMLYEMVVGRVPFNADTPFSIIHDHIYTPLPLPRQIQPEVTEEVQRVLLKSLAKERLDRYTDVASLVAAFRAAYTGQTKDVPAVEPLVAEPPVPDLPPTAISSKETSGGRAPQPEPVKAKLGLPRWGWIVGSVFLLACLCLFSLGAINRLQEMAAANTQTASALTSEAATGPSALQATQAVNALATAQIRSTQNPEDEFAQLDLAIALRNSGDIETALRQLEHTIRMIENEPRIMMQAGQRLMDVEWWSGAALLYSSAVRSANGPLRDEIQPRLQQAYYFATGDPDLPEEWLRTYTSFVSPEFAEILRARRLLYNGQVEQAQNIVEEQLAANPNFYEARLLQGEITYNLGDVETARAIFSELNEQSDAPLWVRFTAQFILTELLN